MNIKNADRHSERGSATVKFAAVIFFIVLFANAAFNYIPVAYQGASFRQEMDSAVVKGLAASGRMKPMETVAATITKAARDYDVPSNAFVEIKPSGAGYIQAHVAYSKPVSIIPFGIYDHKYEFNYVAIPSGYLMKE